MKATNFILSFLFSLIVSAFAAPGIGLAVGATPVVSFVVLLALQFIPFGAAGINMATVYREVWTGAVKEELTNLESASFLDGIEDFSRYVSSVGDEMQVIHLVYMGVQPDVLINNTTYPIPIQVLDQEDTPISLDKYQTKVTPITDDELYALTYQKIATVKSKHARAINQTKFLKAIHSFGPANATNANMPVLVTTGADDGTGRKRITIADILLLKKKLDDLMVPAIGRRLVLCNDHVNDLLLIDQKFKDQYYNYTTGRIANMYSFDVYEYAGNPYYNATTKVKLAFGAVPVEGDFRASVFFSLERVGKANGWTKMYYSEASSDPENQRNLVAFRHNAIYLPLREEARGAIISAAV